MTAVGFDAAARRLAAASRDGVVRIWDVRARHVVDRLRAGRGVTAIALSPRDDVVLTGDRHGIVRLWSADGTPLHVLTGHEKAVTSAAFDPSGLRAVTASEGPVANVIEWDVRKGIRLHTLIGHFRTVARASFSPDGRWIATAGPFSAGIWPADTGRPVRYVRPTVGVLTDAEWSPRGYDIVVGLRDGSVQTYECRFCRPLPALLALARSRLAGAS